MREKLQELALVAEIVGGAAIVASLIFVGIQIRISAQETQLNTGIARASAYQELMDGLNRFNEIVVQDEQLTNLWTNRYALYQQELSDLETERLVFLNRIMFRTYDAAYYSYSYNNLGELEWGRFERAICNAVNELQNSKQDFWEQLEYIVSDGLGAHIEQAC